MYIAQSKSPSGQSRKWVTRQEKIFSKTQTMISKWEIQKMVWFSTFYQSLSLIFFILFWGNMQRLRQTLHQLRGWRLKHWLVLFRTATNSSANEEEWSVIDSTPSLVCFIAVITVCTHVMLIGAFKVPLCTPRCFSEKKKAMQLKSKTINK